MDNKYNYGDEIYAAVLAVMAACTALIALLDEEKEFSVRRYRLTNREAKRRKYISGILRGADETCLSMIHMNRTTFNQLCTLIRQKNLLRDTLNITVEEQMIMFLHTIGHNVRNKDIQLNFSHSGETVSRYFNHVLKAIGSLQCDFVKPPDSTVSNETQSNNKFWPWFKDCIGAVGCTHVHASVPTEIVGRFHGRKDHPTQTVLAAVTFDLKFSYILAGWEGSADDATVLQDALQRPNGLTVPDGKYFLVDAGYTTKPGFITPYHGVRHHPKDFDGCPPTDMKELFNLQHFSLRRTVDRAFAVLKKRFNVLSSYPFFPYKTQVDMVLVCCILHNLIMGMNPNDEFLADVIQEEESQTYTQQRVQEHGEDDEEWEAKRDEIANDMWNAYKLDELANGVCGYLQ